MRPVFAALPILALAACSGSGGAASSNARKIDCAIGGTAAFAKVCSVETVTQGGDKYLFVQSSDGAFRRFRAVDDGRGAVPADGAEDSSARWTADGRLEITVGSDRYLFPASVKPDDAATP
ncbi:hypothetical protein RXV95_10455 [Novosphingobium sp. ZN18A2]|uniref:hypothetical protein n=1 Tax=Novosphingobium sp. ZN18A2 TaxID=3079861 RepID=UPI0030D5FE52